MKLKFNKYKLAIIIPVFNEEKIIDNTISILMPVINKLKVPSELILINDGSKDGTSQILKIAFNKYKRNIVVINHKINKGYGSAIQTGIKEALKRGFTHAIFMDSDLTNNPHDLSKFVDTLPLNYDCVKASRYMKDGGFSNVPVYRIFISYIGNKIASSLFNIGIHDCTNGYRMVKLDNLKDITFKENNFSIILEELYYLKRKNCTFTEIPVILTSRTNTKSHFKYTLNIFWDYFKYVIYASMLLNRQYE